MPSTSAPPPAPESRFYLNASHPRLNLLPNRYDAACRVIARVTKERDDALALVQGADSRFRSSAAASASSAMEVDSGSSYPGISMEIKTKISEIGVELLQQRKKKVVPEGLAAPEALASFKAGKGVAADKEKSPMVLALSLPPLSPPSRSCNRCACPSELLVSLLAAKAALSARSTPLPAPSPPASSKRMTVT
jgi:hypothetical protein